MVVGRISRRAGALVALVLVVLFASACQVRTDVALKVRDDGSGTVTVTVTLDKEAAAQVPDLADQLRTEDLTTAGWKVAGPTAASGGGVKVSATKGFASAAGARSVLNELTGADGPFHDIAVRRSHSFASTKTSVEGTIDLSKGLASFGDAQLTQLLGTPFGRTDDELKLLSGGDVAAAAPFSFRIELPGGGGRTYDAKLGGDPVTVSSTGTQTDTMAYLFVGVGLLVVVLAVVVFVDARRHPDRRFTRPSERGTGTAYERRPYLSYAEVDEGPVPGVGGVPETVRVVGADEDFPEPEPPPRPDPVPPAPTPVPPGPAADEGPPRRPVAPTAPGPAVDPRVRPPDSPPRRPARPAGGPGAAPRPDGPPQRPAPPPAEGQGPARPRTVGPDRPSGPPRRPGPPPAGRPAARPRRPGTRPPREG